MDLDYHLAPWLPNWQKTSLIVPCRNSSYLFFRYRNCKKVKQAKHQSRETSTEIWLTDAWLLSSRWNPWGQSHHGTCREVPNDRKCILSIFLELWSESQVAVDTVPMSEMRASSQVPPKLLHFRGQKTTLEESKNSHKELRIGNQQ